MAGRLAILACAGDMPVQIYREHPDALVITLNGIPSSLEETSQRHHLEKIGSLFSAMKAEGVDRMIFAGSLARPALDPKAFDAEMMAIAPRLMQALSLGDDGLLRAVIEIFEAQGFAVVGVKDVMPKLVVEDGFAVGPAPDDAQERDIARAKEILEGLSALDVGQGCVVAGGQCLGIETVQGTDALLDFVGGTDPKFLRNFKGVYVKAAKKGQDLRVDMPAIGPATISNAAKAGLAGVVVDAGKTMILDRDATLKALDETGLFLIARAL